MNESFIGELYRIAEEVNNETTKFHRIAHHATRSVGAGEGHQFNIFTLGGGVIKGDDFFEDLDGIKRDFF